MGSTIANRIWSFMTGIFLLAGGFFLSSTLLFCYIVYFVSTFNRTIPDSVWSTIFQCSMMCASLYTAGVFLWNTKKREPSINRAGRLSLSISFLLTGMLLSLVVVFFSAKTGETSQHVRTASILFNAGFGSIALGLIVSAVYILKKFKKSDMVCLYCDQYVPEDFNTCPYCNRKIR